MAHGIKLNSPGEIEIVQYRIEENLHDDEVLVRVKAGGICGSDIHIYDGTHPIGDYPKIIGHEFAGYIEKVGKKVTHLHSGDKVVVDPIVNCNSCYACNTLRRPNICLNLKVRGVHLDGGFCTHIAVPADSVYTFTNLSWAAAAMTEPFTIASQILDRSRVNETDTVLINGSGAIGMATLMLAKHIGARVISTDIHDSHLSRAAELGADLQINPLHESLQEKVDDFTEGNGVSVIVDSVGYAATFDSAYACAAPGARIVLIGFDKKNLKISPYDITFNEFEIIGSRLQTGMFQKVIDLFESGEVNPENIVSHRFDYKEAKTVFPFIIENPAQVIKVVLEF